jgi:hypothetical protein
MEENIENGKAEIAKAEREFTYEFKNPKQMVMTKHGLITGKLSKIQIEWLKANGFSKKLKKIWL